MLKLKNLCVTVPYNRNRISNTEKVEHRPVMSLLTAPVALYERAYHVF